MSHVTDFPACLGIAAMRKITVDNRNFYVAPAAAPLFIGFLNEVVKKGYSLDEGILDDWSYNCRDIRDSTTVSEHARGTAVDINAVHNPMGSTLRTDMPWWVPVVAKKWGLRWGGYYTTRKDAMHFEYMGLAADVAAIARAAAGSTTPTPEQADTDGIVPSDPVEVIKFLQVILNLNGQHIPVSGAYDKITGQAIKNLKGFFNTHHVGEHVFDTGPERGWMAGPKFLQTLAAWTAFLHAHGVF
jgi:hypothetical protein